MSCHQELPYHELSDTSPEMPSNGQKRAWSEDDIENPLPRPAKQQKNALGSSVHGQISRLQRGNYTIGWICALHIEMAAARATLDCVHDSPPTSPNDSNAYTLGSIGPHNIVMACLPTSFYGTNNAANVASNMARSFPAIRLCLLVGIGGGVPGDIDMRLGDIVVGCKVMQYDLGKVIGDGLFTRTCMPRIPPQEVLRSISLLRSNHEMKPSRVSSILQEIQTKQPEMAKYACSNHLQDRLFRANYAHDPTKPDCTECADSMQVIRASRTNNDPKIHYGGIASGNQVMKDGITRDRIAKELDVICFEMEAAGLTDHFPCLAIRGICDYSDSHKNKEWQEYSAACAAAYAKELLEAMPTRRADVLIDDTEEALRCRRDLFLNDPLQDREALKRKLGDRAHGTCSWITATEQFRAWMSPGEMARSESQKTNALWLHGNPGTGKSTMAIFLSEWLSNSSANYGYTLAYFFCDSGFNKRNTATSIIRGLLWQLVDRHPQLLSHILPKYRERGPGVFESFDALWPMFVAAAADQNTGRKYCIIDALDECDEESQNILLRQFQEAFQRRDAPLNIKLLVTSRPYPMIREYLADFLNKDMASFPQAKGDIDRCIEHHVARLARKKNYTEKVQRQVHSILQDKAEGTFLWIGLACEELRQQPSNRAIKLLQGMPKGLESIYKQLLDKACQGSEAETVRHILSMVIVSLQPLSIPELSVACSLYEDEVDIETRVQFTRESIESCRLMITIQNEKVFLLHQSVRDYLLGNAVGFIDETQAHSDLAHVCLKILIEHYNSLQSHVHLLPYAIRNWPHHARMAQSRFEIKKSEADFFGIDSPSRKKWLEDLTPQEPQHDFSILHVSAQFGIPALVDHASSLQEQESDREKPRNSLDINQVCSNGTTPLEQAVESGYLTVISKLLDLKVRVTEGVVRAAVKNTNNGKEVMELLLKERGDEIILTEEVMIGVVTYWNCKEVLKVLLTQKRKEITITEEVVKAVARGRAGKEAIELLLNEYGDEITITEEVVKAAAQNWNKEGFIFLLRQREHEIPITEEVFSSIRWNFNSNEVMKCLLNERRDGITITERITSIIASDYDAETMALLIFHQRGQVIITEEVIEAAAGNHNDVLWLLLSHQRDPIAITEPIVYAAFCNSNGRRGAMALLLDKRRKDLITITEEAIPAIALWCNKEVMELLLEGRGDEITITQEVAEAAAGNVWKDGHELMKFLLNERGEEITVTEEVVKAAAGNVGNGKGVVELLLSQRGHEFIITEAIMKAAAGNKEEGEEVMKLLLEERRDEIIITEEVVEAAARCGSDKNLDFLHQQENNISDWDKWYCISQTYEEPDESPAAVFQMFKMFEKGYIES